MEPASRFTQSCHAPGRFGKLLLGAGHNDSAWAQRFPRALEFLDGAGTSDSALCASLGSHERSLAPDSTITFMRLPLRLLALRCARDMSSRYQRSDKVDVNQEWQLPGMSKSTACAIPEKTA